MKLINSLGKVTKAEDGFQVRFERILPFAVNVVWDALTHRDKLAIWFTDIEMEFVVGGKMIIRFQDDDKTESYGQIVRIEAPHLFEFTWEDELATWQIVPLEENRCKLILRYSKLSDQYAFSVPAGWHILLDQLETVLNGRTEPYPFGTGETEESSSMKSIYSEIVKKQFPHLK